MKVEVGFGEGILAVEIPNENVIDILTPNSITHACSGEAEVKRALENPIASPRLQEIVKPGEKIAIITSDVTRPMPSYAVLPHVLDELFAAGVKADDLTVVFGLGNHRKQTEAERRKLVGDRVFDTVTCIDGDVSDTIKMGTTSRGTPVDIVRPVAEADKRICLGNIEYHYFAGYSGGAKAIMPGVSTRDAIQNNHSLMTDDAACAGKLEGNPVREDIEEALRFCPVDFIVNVVLDETKKIVKAVAGDVTKAHRAGCRYLDTLYRKEIPSRADIVIVSQGGAPKDLNLYQTQKALDNAKHAIRKGGIVILVGSCKEGLGEDVFERWMLSAESPGAMIERVKTDFELGGHKAAAIAMVLENADIYLVSEMEPDFVERIFLKPFSDVQSAYDAAIAQLGKDASVIVMPYGGSTLPHAVES